jgi:2-keto-4-pentenoate hydratase/2-oxohepta-3-ene-1,7-dioic acid hydratase in catechol pathway
MKFVTFAVDTVLGSFSRLGLVVEGPDSGERWFLDLNAAYTRWLVEMAGESRDYAPVLAEALVPACMRRFIEAGDRALDAVLTVRLWLESLMNGPRQSLSEMSGIFGEKLLFEPDAVRLLAPLPKPASLRDFMAFENHMKAGSERRGIPVPENWYKFPVYYKGNSRTIVGPDAPVLWPAYTEKLDFELELGCVIGRAGRNIDERQATNHIFGLTVINDFSARDVQLAEMACRLGPAKGKDFATGMGPCIVTLDELPGLPSLRMVARVNGETWAEANYDQIYWRFEQMIARVSEDETLYPADVFGSGTPFGGCGLDQNRWIQPGDTVELEIEGIGVLRHQVLKADQMPEPCKSPRQQLLQRPVEV